MILTILILMISMLGLCIAGRKSNITIPVFVKISGLILILFSSLEYIIKISIYRTIFDAEWKLYFLLSGIKLNISGIVFINVFGIALYMAASIVMTASVKKEKIGLKSIAASIPISALLIAEIPGVKESMYLSMLSGGMSLAETKAINDFKMALECGLLVIYIIIPYVNLAKEYKKTVLCERRREIISATAVWGVTDISLTVTVFGGGIYRYMYLNLGWIGFSGGTAHLSNEAVAFYSSLACAIIILFIVARYMPVRAASKGTQMLMKEKDENVFSLLHTYKNAFCAIMMYADAKDGDSETLFNNKTRLEMVRDIAEEQCEKINSAMVMFKTDVKGMKHNVDLNECVKMAIPKTKADVKLIEKAEEVNIVAEEYKIVECIVCMLNNSYEAVKNNKGEKLIEVTVGREHSDCYLEIRDNGCGIAGKDMNKIFKPFYSTKKRADNYGLGLTYVRRAVRSYGGSITVKSKKDKFTVIQVVFREAHTDGKN